MSRYKPPAIENIGLRQYLDNTKDMHNGYGYEDFVRLIDSGVNKANLARAFKVERPTIYKWLKLYNQSEEAYEKDIL